MVGIPATRAAATELYDEAKQHGTQVRSLPLQWAWVCTCRTPHLCTRAEASGMADALLAVRPSELCGHNGNVEKLPKKD